VFTQAEFNATMQRPPHHGNARSILKLDPAPERIGEFWVKEEEEFLAEYLPRAESKFSQDYCGRHFHNLPSEILQIIATYTSREALFGRVVLRYPTT